MSTVARLRLEPRPSTIRVLTDPEGQRLKTLHEGLPKSLAHCITCGGATTFMWRDQHGRPAEYDCDCRDQWIMHRYFLHSGLDVLYQRYSWADTTGVDPAVMDKALAYCDHIDAYMRTGRGLVLRGAMTGTGKTLIAALLFKKILAMGHDGYFTQFNDLLDANAAGWRNEEERRWFVRRVRNAGILVIDDVGREYRNAELVESTFDQVIRARHDGCRPTIITTNKDEGWWSTRYQGNVMSLLSGTCQVIDVTGQDYRTKQAAAADEEAIAGLIRPVVVW